jgi:hypothetical protein
MIGPFQRESKVIGTAHTPRKSGRKGALAKGLPRPKRKREIWQRPSDGLSALQKRRMRSLLGTYRLIAASLV